MTRLVKDDTLRTAPTPNPALWSQFGPGTLVPQETGGWWDFSTLTTAYARHVVLKQTANPLDQGILTMITRAATSGGARLRIWVSHSGDAVSATGEQPTNGFAVSINQAGDFALLQSSAATVTTLSAAVTGKVATNTNTWVRLERTAGVVRARAWADGSSEPSTWDHSVTDPGTTGAGSVPTGSVGISYYRSPNTSTVIKAGKVQVYTPAGGFPATNRCKLLARPDGSRLAFGRQATTLLDDCTVSAPAFLTGTGTLDVPSGTRTISAAAGATSQAAFTGLQGDALILTAHNVRLSTDTDASIALRFTPDGGTTNYELRHNTAETTAKLVAGATTTLIGWQWRSNAEGPKHRTATLMLVPAAGVLQLIALEGDWRTGTVLGWATLPGAVTRTTTMVGSLLVTAGSAAQTVAYTALSLEAQRL